MFVISNIFILIAFGLLDVDCGNVKGDAEVTAVLKPSLKVRLTTEPDWIKHSIERHNYFRSLHDAKPLIHNRTLSEISQSWANYMLARTLERIRKNDNKFDDKVKVFFEHQSEVNRKFSLGENLAFTTHSNVDYINGSYAVNRWYDEIKDYDFVTASVKSTSPPDSKIGHLTQLLWKSTTQMGTAYATAILPGGRQSVTFIGANYHTAGNVLYNINPKQAYFKNVLPPTGNAQLEIPNVHGVIREKIERLNIPRADKISTDEIWIQEAIEKHNEFRMKHYFPPLEISEDLCKVAQWWANQLLHNGLRSFNRDLTISIKTQRSFATTGLLFGENSIYFVGNGLIDPSYPVSLWYHENKFYDFEAMRTNFSISRTALTSQYEQLIWKSTSHIGIAVATGEAENGQILTFIVANYYPPAKLYGPLEEKVANIPSSSSRPLFNSHAVFYSIYHYMALTVNYILLRN